MYYNQLVHHGVKGQKWGVRRYQNSDGTLTAAGQKRYDQDVRENLSKKKDNRIDTSNPDPNRWVREDIERKKNVIDKASSLNTKLQDVEKSTRKKESFDLSSMSDEDLRNAINRKQLENRYADLFSKQSESTLTKGRNAVAKTLEVSGKVLGVAGSAASLALAIQKLKG